MTPMDIMIFMAGWIAGYMTTRFVFDKQRKKIGAALFNESVKDERAARALGRK